MLLILGHAPDISADIAGRAYTTLPESPMIRAIQDGSYDGPLLNQQDVVKTRLDALMGSVQVGEVMTKVKKWQGERFVLAL
jgi:hypothetical protein